MQSPAGELDCQDSILKPAVESERVDVALDFLATHETVTYTREEEKRVIHKIDMVLMPLVRLDPPLSVHCTLESILSA